MSTELIINGGLYETRVALVENGQVTELHVERRSDRGIAGNIYKGRVVRVLPGMQAAFVDINMEKAAFLYVSDIYHPMSEVDQLLAASCEIPDGEVESPPEESAVPDSLNGIPEYARGYNDVPIEDKLQEGQEVLAQVAKEPIGHKGARITTHITIPGRHVVLMPTMDHIGVSRRIENEKERKRLRDFMCTVKPPHCGFIVRTAAEGEDEEKLQYEVEFLTKLWDTIQRKSEHAGVPSLVYQELDIILRAVRDLFTKEVDRLIVDSEEEYEKILNFTETFMPSLKNAVELYTGDEPIFDFYGIEMEVQRALSKKIWLKSGGYIVIETTEALTAVDVNTGRYVGKRNLEETILKTNLEAVREIAYQLRLRNIGGIIIIDFIDMEKEVNREKVFNALKDAMKRDKSKTNILHMSELGLIEMTRKRTRESIWQVLCEPCFYCEGEGYLKSTQTVCYEILRELERDHREYYGQNVTVIANPRVAARFCDEERLYLDEIEEQLHARIMVRGETSLHLEQYEITVVE